MNELGVDSGTAQRANVLVGVEDPKRGVEGRCHPIIPTERSYEEQ